MQPLPKHQTNADRPKNERATVQFGRQRRREGAGQKSSLPSYFACCLFQLSPHFRRLLSPFVFVIPQDSGSGSVGLGGEVATNAKAKAKENKHKKDKAIS